MRILCVHNKFQQYGGADAVFESDLRLLSQNADVMTYTRHSGEIESAALWQKLRFGMQAVYSRRTAREITELVQNFRPDVAYVHNILPLISPSLCDVLHRLRVPIVHVIHDYRLWCSNSRFYIQGRICERCKLGNYWPAVFQGCVRGNVAYSAVYSSSLYLNRKLGLLHKIGGYICLTEFTKKRLLETEIPENRLHVCPNHIDTSLYNPQFGGGKYVLYIGGLYNDKGALTLVKAFAKLPHIPLKIIGSGPAEEEMRHYIRDQQMANVDMVGFKSGQEKLDYLRNSMFTIVPSHFYETFGVVVLEAYASGKPVVASATGSLPYIVRPHETGLLFEPQNSNDLAEKASWLYERPEEIETMGRKARDLVEGTYDSRLRYPALEAIFKDVIANADMN